MLHGGHLQRQRDSQKWEQLHVTRTNRPPHAAGGRYGHIWQQNDVGIGAVPAHLPVVGKGVLGHIILPTIVSTHLQVPIRRKPP